MSANLFGLQLSIMKRVTSPCRSLLLRRLGFSSRDMNPELLKQTIRGLSSLTISQDDHDDDVDDHHLLSWSPDQQAEAKEIIDSIKFSSALPSVVYLYDDDGSALFEAITQTPEYYPTRTELSILQTNAAEMVRFRDELDQSHGEEGEDKTSIRKFKSSLIELGAGSGQKLHPLLDALANTPKASYCTYVPADYSASALEMNLQVFNSSHNNVVAFKGTHEEALASLHTRSGRKTWAYLVSSLGNYLDPVPFLKNLATHCGPRDRILLGIDLAARDNKPAYVIQRAYSDSQGITERFILNSLKVVNRTAGLNFDVSKLRLAAEYNSDTQAVKMYAECVAKCDVTVESTGELVRSLKPGDRIFIEQSGKFTESGIKSMIRDAGLIELRRWSDDQKYFSVLELVPDLPATATRLSEFIFKDLIGEDNLSHQPLLLRNPFAFYWSHISAFSDRMALDLPGRETERDTFERGVDPDVDDPTKIHRHQSWPTAYEFEAYANEVDEGLHKIIANEGVKREMLLSLEHAEMHHETLMYMVLQMEGKSKQTYSHPFAEFRPCPIKERAVPAGSFVRVESTQARLGASEDQAATAGFVWDNELPPYTTLVDSFNCAVCPVTNSEFKDFVEDSGYKFQEFWNVNKVNEKVMSAGGAGAWNWIQREGIKKPLFWKNEGVHTLGGIVPFQQAGDWPVVVSLFEAAAYCRWYGKSARIMTEAEYHALFSGEEDFNNAAHQGNNNWRFQGVIPVGIMNDATDKGIHDLVGNGWEWTASPFGGFDGFQPMPDHREYSTDFFDGKHFVLKGASPYTGKLVQRMSFRNFYQPNYPYPIDKFRIVT